MCQIRVGGGTPDFCGRNTRTGRFAGARGERPEPVAHGAYSLWRYSVGQARDHWHYKQVYTHMICIGWGSPVMHTVNTLVQQPPNKSKPRISDQQSIHVEHRMFYCTTMLSLLCPDGRLVDEILTVP